MGLDMFLNRRRKYKIGDGEYNRLVDENCEEVMYWRKANQIRAWFVANTDLNDDDNCRTIIVTEENLEQLYEDCQTVLKDHSKASKILPCSSGFFFGSQKYDEWYFEDLKATVDAIERIIEETNFDEYEIEYYEWW